MTTTGTVSGSYSANPDGTISLSATLTPAPAPTPTPTPTPTPAPAPSSPKLGLYAGQGAVTAVAAFAQATKVPLSIYHDFLPGDSWQTISGQNLAWFWDPISGIEAQGVQLLLSVPMLPRGVTLATVASGSCNTYFVKLAQTLVAEGHTDAIIRPGWEFGGNWETWYAGGDPSSYAAAFRQIVTSMTSVQGQHFTFCWCPCRGWLDTPSGTFFDQTQAWPGASYVDFIGIDLYAETGRTPVASETVWTEWDGAPDVAGQGQWTTMWQAFAQSVGKPVCFPEWGCSTKSDGSGTGDDPAFIKSVRAFIDPSVGNNVAFACYFDFDPGDGKHSISTSHFPNAYAAYCATFSGL